MGHLNHIRDIISSFSQLGNELDKICSVRWSPGNSGFIASSVLNDETDRCRYYNPWFIPDFVRFAFRSWANALTEEKVSSWLAGYSFVNKVPGNYFKVAVIMAGNIPLVGLHDLLCVLASGNKAIVKLSSQDDRLIPAVINLLIQIDPAFKDQIEIQENFLKGFDAVIATGSNNTSRYFDYYFGKYPNIIRRNRNSIAVLTGEETEEELQELANDIFVYFGLGCRNISKIYCPGGYDFGMLFSALDKYSFLSDHNKYRNNYDYQKSIFIINGITFQDNGFLILKKDRSLVSPVSVIHYEEYEDVERVNEEIALLKESLQCVVSASTALSMAIEPGKAQFPELWDYADGIDSMQFLLQLKKK